MRVSDFKSCRRSGVSVDLSEFVVNHSVKVSRKEELNNI